MRLFFDTEFIEDGRTIDLLAIGIVREDGARYYAEPAEADRAKASEWVRENVLPHLSGPVKPRATIAREIAEFAGASPEWWAYYAAYDWVALCQLYGTMMELPNGWPMFVRDFRTICDAPPIPEENIHHALLDADWLRRAWMAKMGAN